MKACGDELQLGQVVEVVAGQHLDDVAHGLGAALGVMCRTREVGGGQAPDEVEVPLAKRPERPRGHGAVETMVAGGPSVLVKTAG